MASKFLLKGKFRLVDNVAECTICGARLKYHRSNSSLNYHLRNRHQLDVGVGRLNKIERPANRQSMGELHSKESIAGHAESNTYSDEDQDKHNVTAFSNADYMIGQNIDNMQANSFVNSVDLKTADIQSFGKCDLAATKVKIEEERDITLMVNCLTKKPSSSSLHDIPEDEDGLFCKMLFIEMKKITKIGIKRGLKRKLLESVYTAQEEQEASEF